jgi:hypothetical protein
LSLLLSLHLFVCLRFPCHLMSCHLFYSLFLSLSSLACNL